MKISGPGGIRTFANSLVAWTAIAALSFPMIWALMTSFKPKSEILAFPVQFWPEHLTFDAYRRILFETAFLRFFMNSIVVASAASMPTVTARSTGDSR